jgi:hypothetical protein
MVGVKYSFTNIFTNFSKWEPEKDRQGNGKVTVLNTTPGVNNTSKNQQVRRHTTKT